jgi:hypothetical protein
MQATARQRKGLCAAAGWVGGLHAPGCHRAAEEVARRAAASSRAGSLLVSPPSDTCGLVLQLNILRSIGLPLPRAMVWEPGNRGRGGHWELAERTD